MEFNSFGMSPALIVAMLVTAAVAGLVPLIAAFVGVRKLEGGVKHVIFGLLTFLVFQLLTRIPLITVGGLALQDTLAESTALQWVWLVALSFSAGLFEEGGRWVAFRYGFKDEERTWDKAVLMGIGHGGFESMVLVGLSVAATLGVMLFMPPDMLAADPEAIPALEAAASQDWWVALLGGFERLMAMLLHVALSVVVFQCWARGGVRWVFGAMLLHGVANFAVVGIMKVVSDVANPQMAALAAEGAMLVVGIVSLAYLVTSRPAAESA